jgi:hypothetical protein
MKGWFFKVLKVFIGNERLDYEKLYKNKKNV